MAVPNSLKPSETRVPKSCSVCENQALSYFRYYVQRSYNNNNDNNNNNRIQNLLTAPRTVSNTHAQVARAQSCASHVNTSSGHHVQHVMLCATWCKGYKGSAIKFDRVDIAFYLSFIFWAGPLTDEGGEETGVPGENPWRRASENAYTKARRFKPQARLEPAH